MFSIFSINVPNSFTASINGVAVDVQDNKIQWGIQGVENKELEVSYKIGRKTGAPAVKEGTLVVKYLEEGTGNELSPSVTTTKPVGDSYTTAAENIQGYDFVRVEGQANGQYVDGTTEVKYIYKKTEVPVKEGTVVVKHLEEGSGKELAPSLVTKEPIAENYSTVAKNIDGYEFVKIEGQAEGKYIDGSIEVKYIYRKILATVPSNNEINNKVKAPENIVENNLPKTGGTSSLPLYLLGSVALICALLITKRK